MNLKNFLGLALIMTVFSAKAHADAGNFTVTGMHCGACAKMISAKVCKMDGIDKCDVKMGMISVTTKEGVSLDAQKVQSLVTEAGEEYKISKSEITKSGVATAAPTTPSAQPKK